MLLPLFHLEPNLSLTHLLRFEEYKKYIADLLAKPENLWIKTGGSAETMKLIQEENRLRYNQ